MTLSMVMAMYCAGAKRNLDVAPTKNLLLDAVRSLAHMRPKKNAGKN